MANKIAVKEKAKEKQIRLESEKMLKTYKGALRDPNTDISELRNNMITIGNDIKKKRIREVVRHLLLPLTIDDRNLDTLTVPTPSPVKLLTELNKKVSVVNKYLIANVKDRSAINGDSVMFTKEVKEIIANRFPNYIKEATTIMDSFEIELRLMFDSTESLLNALAFNFDENISFNNLIYKLLNGNVITKVEYNILKLFNSLRNVLAHNLSTEVIMTIANANNIMLYKAILLETRDLIVTTSTRNTYRLMCYEGRCRIDNSENITDDFMDAYRALVADTKRFEEESNITLPLTESV